MSLAALLSLGRKEEPKPGRSVADCRWGWVLLTGISFSYPQDFTMEKYEEGCRVSVLSEASACRKA